MSEMGYIVKKIHNIKQLHNDMLFLALIVKSGAHTIILELVIVLVPFIYAQRVGRGRESKIM